MKYLKRFEVTTNIPEEFYKNPPELRSKILTKITKKIEELINFLSAEKCNLAKSQDSRVNILFFHPDVYGSKVTIMYNLRAQPHYTNWEERNFNYLIQKSDYISFNFDVDQDDEFDLIEMLGSYLSANGITKIYNDQFEVEVDDFDKIEKLSVEGLKKFQTTKRFDL